jgi:flagellar basal-body rod protein FlgC
MSLLSAIEVSATGLTAQRQRMDIISSNLANANTTRTEEGGPFRRKDLVFESANVNEAFSSVFDFALERATGTGVQVIGIYEDNTPFIRRYNPAHPDADGEGYVLMPNINSIEEMVNLISATRSFEANAQAISAIKEIAQKSVELGR